MNNLNFLCHSDEMSEMGRPFPEKQVTMNSSTGSAGPLPCITNYFADPINVVSTTIDTRGMKKTNNLLIFTSTICLPIGISVTLNFQITRTSSEGGTIKVGSTYTFSTIVTVLEAEAFSFQFFDSNIEQGNYTYSVDISTNSKIDITPGVTVNSGTLSVIAVKD
jgi:hypothetical protein